MLLINAFNILFLEYFVTITSLSHSVIILSLLGGHMFEVTLSPTVSFCSCPVQFSYLNTVCFAPLHFPSFFLQLQEALELQVFIIQQIVTLSKYVQDALDICNP